MASAELDQQLRLRQQTKLQSFEPVGQSSHSRDFLGIQEGKMIPLWGSADDDRILPSMTEGEVLKEERYT